MDSSRFDWAQIRLIIKISARVSKSIGRLDGAPIGPSPVSSASHRVAQQLQVRRFESHKGLLAGEAPLARVCLLLPSDATLPARFGARVPLAGWLAGWRQLEEARK